MSRVIMVDLQVDRVQKAIRAEGGTGKEGEWKRRMGKQVIY